MAHATALAGQQDNGVTQSNEGIYAVSQKKGTMKPRKGSGMQLSFCKRKLLFPWKLLLLPDLSKYQALQPNPGLFSPCLKGQELLKERYWALWRGSCRPPLVLLVFADLSRQRVERKPSRGLGRWVLLLSRLCPLLWVLALREC